MRSTQFLVVLSASIFGGEMAIMFALDAINIKNKILENVIDSTALVAIVFPIIYILVLKSLHSMQSRLEEGIIERTAELASVNDDLTNYAYKVNVSRRKMSLLREMGDFFQACSNIEEAAAIAQVHLDRLFPDVSGALFLMNSSKNLLENVGAWGPANVTNSPHSPDECWALRRSKPHFVKDSEHALACRHMRAVEAPWHFCIPVTAHGELLGTLSIHSNAHSADENSHEIVADEEWIEFCVAVAENLALAFANLRLRDKLRYQAIRDPLTGLFNRRYLFETLECELERAFARDQAVSVVMFDIDHFKSFNDAFGHNAGDLVLARFGTFLKDWSEDNDILARYGGEEFIIAMPNTSSELAFERAKSLRKEIESFAIEYHKQSLGQVTISLGVATYPIHGEVRESLIQSADQALYRSKHNGRNQTSVANRSAREQIEQMVA